MHNTMLKMNIKAGLGPCRSEPDFFPSCQWTCHPVYQSCMLFLFIGDANVATQVVPFALFTLIIRWFIHETSLNLCHHSLPGSVSQHLLSQPWLSAPMRLLLRSQEETEEKAKWDAKGFIHTLLYLGYQRIRWKIGTGDKVIQFYLNWKKTGLVTLIEGKLASQALSNPSSPGLEVFPAGDRDVTITLALSEVLKTIVQCRHNKQWVISTTPTVSWFTLKSRTHKCQTTVHS